MSRAMKKNVRYIPALDGLRAVAVLAVIAYHLDLGWAKGGFLGVGVFFVLSGYLITDLLISEWRRSGRIDLTDFWLRRARRLLPAMLAMLAAVACLLALADRTRLSGIQGDIWSSVFYISNWWQIFHQVSYFESFGPPSPLGHLWSLAVEEQFYLVWPLVMLLALKMKRARLLALVLGGALLSAWAMAALYEPGSDPSRVYYGTDTRAFALFIGAALALLRPGERLAAAGPLSRSAKIALELCGTAGLLTVVVMLARTGEFEESLYPGGFLVLSGATAILIGALVHPRSSVGGALSWKPLRWIGVRSYGLYLWHYPVIVLTSPTVQADGRPFFLPVLQVAASLLLAALSWRFIEVPVKNGAINKLWRRAYEWRRRAAAAWPGKRLHGAASLCALVVLCISCSGYVGAGAETPADLAGGTSLATAAGSYGQSDAAGQPVHPDLAGDSSSSTSVSGNVQPRIDRLGAAPGREDLPASAVSVASVWTAADPTGSSAPSARTAAAAPPDPAQDSGEPGPSSAEPEAGRGITVIGDSVILDAEPYLKKALPGMVVDGKIGRQMSQAADTLTGLREAGKLGSLVVIELGTNGSFTEKQLKGLLDSLSDAERILLINTRVPRKWQDTVNESLESAVKEYPKAELVDWYASSAGNGDYFEQDGVHLKPQGAEAYASMVLKALGAE